MLVPLTTLDGGPSAVCMCSCFVFALPSTWTADDNDALIGRVEAAAERVVKKWRLLSGRPERTKAGVWAIRVPDDLDALHDKPLVAFSTATRSEPYHVAAGLSSPLPPFSAASSGFLPSPKAALFYHTTRPSSLAAHAKTGAPLVNLHLTLCTDAVAIGISVSHGLLDGTGIGLLLSALSAELHGKEWQAPPLPEDGTNPFIAALDRLEADETVFQQAAREPPPPISQGWRPATLGRGIKLLLSMLWENWWYGSHARWVFLRQVTVDVLVERVKEDIKDETEGREYVSTGDVLAAWLLKAAHAKEKSAREALSASALYSSRSLLDAHSPSSPSLALYPHNAAIAYPLLSTDLPLSTLSTISVSTLALSFRRQLPLHRTLPSLLTIWQGLQKSELLPHRDWLQPPSFLRLPSLFLPRGKITHTHRFLFSNQLSVGMGSFSLPDFSSHSGGGEAKDLPLIVYYNLGEGPVELDSVLPIQQTEAGVTVSATMRKSRWESLERAIRELEEEGASR
ncbi:hypothetical protein JCM8547_006001 [Rhodosporidiobolus lusitaniae]